MAYLQLLESSTLLYLHSYNQWFFADQHFVQAIRVERSGGGRVVNCSAEPVQAAIFQELNSVKCYLTAICLDEML